MSESKVDHVSAANHITQGVLFVVATPIGNRQDISLRAVEILKKCDRILCEDTRHSQPFLKMLGINVPTVSLHQHNERSRSEDILGWLKRGEDLALIADAGTPALSDPGAHAVRSALKAGFRVSPIPGACAAIAAWSGSGFAAISNDIRTQGFTFIGFLPTDKKTRRILIADMAESPRPIILYEAPHRLGDTLLELEKFFPTNHPMFYAREISKIYEGSALLTLGDFRARLAAKTLPSLGEWVLILEPLPPTTKTDAPPTAEIARRLRLLLKDEKSPSSLARLIHQVTGLPRQEIYQQLLNEQ